MTRSTTSPDLIADIEDPYLQAMVADLMSAPLIHRPSAFWENYARLNIEQIQTRGLENFKTTVNQNYFNWVAGSLRDQRQAMVQDLGNGAYLSAYLGALFAPSRAHQPPEWKYSAWHKYVAFVRLLTKFTLKHDRFGWLEQLQEPELGAPLTVEYGGRRMSQDLCNSVLELNAALEGSDLPERGGHIMELGAGYGRVGYCALAMMQGIRYTIVDIAPALYIAQWYLERLFPEKRVFRYRAFDDFETVREEYEAADIAFLLPHQAEHLPDKPFDLVINISSLHEMTREQIDLWFTQIDRLSRGHFYTKQWIRQQNDVDGIVVTREDYPARDNWDTRYNRQCVVQPRFFEALYAIGD